MSDIVRRASLPPSKDGMSDVQLRRYNTPNNEEAVFNDDPVYIACPELRDKMKSRALGKKEYDTALEGYKAEQIMLLLDADAKYVRQKREEMFRREMESSLPWILEGSKTWTSGSSPRYATH